MNIRRVSKVVFVVLGIAGLVFYGKDYWQKVINLSTKPASLEGNPDISKKVGAASSEIETKLPEDFPQGFPVYPGAKLVSSSQALGEAGKGLSVVWEAEDSLESISKFYETELVNDGWTLSSRLEGDSFLTFSIEKGEIKGFVGITKEKEKRVAVSVSLGVK